MIFELWHSKEHHCYSYYPRDENYQRNREFDKKLYPDSKLVFAYDAKSYFEAMQAKNDFLGFEEYKPEPDWEDIFYDE